MNNSPGEILIKLGEKNVAENVSIKLTECLKDFENEITRHVYKLETC